MEFDRSAPGRGAEAKCKLENGKAFLEWRFYLTDGPSDMEVREPQPGPSQFGQTEFGEPPGPSQPMRCGTYAGRDAAAGSQPVIRVALMDGEGNVAAEGLLAAGEEEPLETVLVQPHLWQGTRDPFLYEVEAVLIRQGICLDRVRTQLCLRRLEAGGEGEVLLNGQPLEVRAVAYSLPDTGSETERRSRAVSDFRQLSQLGANSICLDGKSPSPFLLSLCDRFGFLALETDEAESRAFPGRERAGLLNGRGTDLLNGEGTESVNSEGTDALSSGEERVSLICTQNKAVKVYWREKSCRKGERVPAFRAVSDAFFLPDRKCPTALYYQYKAKWSKEPFVYLVPESVKKLKSGCYAVTCYSSCSRVALYTDGELFEFKKGDGEFLFQEIPARTPCIRLSAEGDGCSAALSLHKSFVKSFCAD